MIHVSQLIEPIDFVMYLQSSINIDAGLGNWSQTTVYISLILSSMFIPTWMIKTLKCKWTMVVSYY